MPVYEYRCPECGEVTSLFSSIENKPATARCSYGCDADAYSIISKQSVRLSNLSKVERLDPKYDKMVDRAVQSNPLADPDRYVNRRGDPAKGRSDDA